MRNFSISWVDNFTPDRGEGGGGGGRGRCYVMTLRWYMAGRWARTSSLPEKSRERQSCPFAPVTLQDWRLSSRGVRWSFPAVLTDIKKGGGVLPGALHPAWLKTAHRSNLLSSPWFQMKKKKNYKRQWWCQGSSRGKTVRRSQVDEVKVKVRRVVVRGRGKARYERVTVFTRR